jgi:GNAT superfamily N-acetyltransferase
MFTTINEWFKSKYKVQNGIKYTVEKTVRNNYCGVRLMTQKNDCIGKFELEFKEGPKGNGDYSIGYQYTQESFAYLRLVIVYDEYRRMGFADILVNIAIEHARKWDCQELYVRSGPLMNNISLPDLTRLYARHGFKELKTYMQGTDMVMDL